MYDKCILAATANNQGRKRKHCSSSSSMFHAESPSRAGQGTIMSLVASSIKKGQSPARTTPGSKSDLQTMQPMQRRTSLAHMSPSEKMERRKEQARDRKRRVRENSI